jgi:hypothetical protein
MSPAMMRQLHIRLLPVLASEVSGLDLRDEDIAIEHKPRAALHHSFSTAVELSRRPKGKFLGLQTTES